MCNIFTAASLALLGFALLCFAARQGTQRDMQDGQTATDAAQHR